MNDSTTEEQEAKEYLARYSENWFWTKDDEIVQFSIKYDLTIAGLCYAIYENEIDAGTPLNSLEFWNGCISQLDTLLDSGAYDYNIENKEAIKELEKIRVSDPTVWGITIKKAIKLAGLK